MNMAEPRTSTAVDYDPFADAPLARVVPSTEAQREIWLAAKLDTAASLAYNESVSLRLHGALDAGALREALQTLTARHEALRASLSADGRDFCIAERVELPFAQRDLSALAPAAREDEIAATLQRVVETPFDLENGPLIGAELLRLAADEYLLVLNTHHIVCDGWSFGVLVRELAALYSAARTGATPALAGADSFAEFALAEAARADSETQRAAEAYWLARFASTPAPLDLPRDRPRPRRRTFASRREDLTLDATLVGALRKAGAQRGASLYATLLAAFGVLLQRLSGQDDIVIGIPAAGQAGGGHHALVGHAVNVLPLRATIDAAAPFADVLTRVRGDLLDAFEHQQYTFGTLLKRLALPRDPARLPLVALLFNLDQELAAGTLAFADLRFEFAGVPRRFENFELFINAVQVDGALRLECQYNSDLFDAATVARWLDAYATLLRGVLADPLQSVAALPLLSESGAAALRALQPAPTAFARDRRIEALLFEQAARTPERSALRCGELQWTYAQLAARARQIAAALRARGIGAGDLVGLALERGPDMLAALLGVLHAGAGYVPLDPAFPRERLDFMAADAKLALLLTQTALAGRIDWPQDKTLVLDDGTPLGGAGDAAIESSGDAGAIAYVIYTSGSTGKPKGVCVPHRAVVNFLTSMRNAPGLAADDRLLAVTTLSFDIAVLELLLPLSVGAEVVLASHAAASDGHALAELIDRHGVTVMQATPATWRLLLEAEWPGRAGFKALCGGEALPPDLSQALLSRCESLWNLYGPTETTVWSTCWRVEQPERGISIGRPIANTTAWILDTGDQACPMGIPGEIAIGGAGVTLGYLGRADLTAERFIADPFANAPGARLYRTGDRGRWRNDGSLEHLGRLDFQVKLRGFRIELGEVEANLMSHPAIARVVALVREDRPGDQRLVAYLTPHAGAAVDPAALRAHLRTTLPEYMLPQHYVTLDAIPLLPNGKIDRKALPAPFANAGAAGPAHVAPRNEVERRIATAMETTLSLPGIGIHDDFFALGGHSLLAAQMATQLSHAFGVALPLRAVFDAPTVAGLAATLASGTARVAVPRIERRADQHQAPLSLQQKGLWLFEQLNPGSVVYNTPSAHRLHGALDEAAFQRAFDALLQRQSVLRTSIGHADGEVVQCIHDDLAIELFPAEDLSGLATAARETELLRRLDELTNRPFDLGSAPLFRVRLFRLAPAEHVLFFMPHHIIFDGWSFDLFYEDFAALYRAFREAREPVLAALPVSYGDFAAWQAHWLGGAEYAAQRHERMTWWRERLLRCGAPRRLPVDRPRQGAGAAGRGETIWLAIPAPLTEALRTLAQEHDTTLYGVLIAVYAALLQRLCGTRHLTIGTPVRVRGSVEIEPLMGLFTNLLPLALDVEPTARFDDVVAAARHSVLDALASPDVQIEDLMQEPALRALAGDAPLYQAEFSFQDARQRVRDWGGLRQEQIALFQRGASDDLAVWFLDHGQGMIGGVVYRSDLIRTETAQALAQRYQVLLERIVADARQSIDTLTRITEAEFTQLRGWNAARIAAPAAAPAQERFDILLAGDDSRSALRAGSWSTSRGDIDQRANRLAACLAARGVRAGQAVALAAEHGGNRIAALFAIQRLGAIGVLLDPADPAERLRECLADAGVDVLVAESPLQVALAWPPGRSLRFDLDAAEIMAAASVPAPPPAPADGGSVAFAVYSADAPARGIGLTHAGLRNLLDHLRRQPELAACTSLLASAGAGSAWALVECLLALGNGLELVQASRDERRDGAALLRLLDAAPAPLMFAPAAIWRRLLAAGWSGTAGLQAVCIDAPLPADLADQLIPRCAGLWATFGVDAATLIASSTRVAAVADDLHAGQPIANARVWVLDAQRQPCAPGVIGALYIGGVGIARPFGRNATASPPAPVADPAEPAAYLLDSGRCGRWRADGCIEVLGADEGAASLLPQASPALRAEAAEDEPRSTAERWLADLWKNLLGVPQVLLCDNFFDLGGHSLLAMEMMTRVERATRIRLNLLRIANSTLRALAADLPATFDPLAEESAPSLGQRMRKLFGRRG